MAQLKRTEYQRKYREEHRLQAREYWRKHIAVPENREHKNMMNTLYRQTHKEEIRRFSNNWYVDNREHHLETIHNQRKSTRLETMRHYSPDLKCVKCGYSDTRALSFDHINGGGHKHRKDVGGRIWYWLIKNNYPSGFQILCMNCQFIKRIEQREFPK